MTKKQIPIYGMHCESCELLVTSKISKLSWVHIKHLSRKNNFIELELDDEKDLPKVLKIIQDLWYDIEKPDTQKRDLGDFIVIFLLFILFWILFFLLKDRVFFQDILLSQNASLPMVLLIWVVASLSTCLAITGWIILWISNYHNTSKSISKKIFLQLNFHIGRIVGFALWWGILWVLWWYIGSFLWFNLVLLFITWVIMILMWGHILWILPRIFSFKIWWKYLGKIFEIKHPLFVPFVWALTFFLPCWFTQWMQIYAASSGNFLSWALIMWAFALGTFPILFAIGFWSSYFKDKNFPIIHKITWVIIVYFWIFLLSSFWSLFSLWEWQSIDKNLEKFQNIQFIEKFILHNWLSFDQDIYLKSWENYTLKILPTKDGAGCSSTLTIPGLDNTIYEIKAGEMIEISLLNTKKGTYNIVCSTVGNKQWRVIIE